jgi:hypothetical protein
MNAYRQTVLRLANNCPHSAKLHLDTPRVATHPMLRGQAFHRFADRAVRALVENDESYLAQADGKAILHEVLCEPDLVVPTADVELLRLMVFHFCETFRLSADATDVHTECPVKTHVGATEITGTIDLWWREGSTIHMRDWKAGYGLVPQDDVSSGGEGGHRGAKAFQLIIYALGWNATFDPRGIERFDCRFVFPAFDGMIERDVQIDAADMIEHRLWLETIVSRMKTYEHTGDWPAVPGTHCSQCPAPKRCPIPADLRPVDDLDLYDDGPLAYALRGWQLEAELKRVKATLKAHVEEYGPIPVGPDLAWQLQTITASRTDAAAKARLNNGEIVPPEQLFKQSTSTRFALSKVKAA